MTSGAVRIEETEHAGHAALALHHAGARLVLVHAIGPRIGGFALAGREDVLFWDHAGAHRRGPWRLYGGHRLWVTRPGADESEDTYTPDNAPCSITREPAGVALAALPDRAGITRGLEVRAADGAWTITHRLRNDGDMLWSGGAWALTCTRPHEATRYHVPLDGGPPGWDVLTLITPRRWGGGHTSRLVDPQITLSEDALHARALGDEAKRMLYAPRGALVMADPARGVFTKTAAPRPGAPYPRGANVALYLGPARDMVELETMSPVVTLAPGEELVHAEIWTLTP